jgi:hypothetical protein
MAGDQMVGWSAQDRAILWTGPLHDRVDLHPNVPGAARSYAFGVSAQQQVGAVQFSDGNDHAALWSGSAASYTDLSPQGTFRSTILATDGEHQVGAAWFGTPTNAVLRPVMWSGTASSAVDLSPPDRGGVLYAMSGSMQGGASTLGGVPHATIWSGSASTWQDLHPLSGGSSEIRDMNGDIQVGMVKPAGARSRAALWMGIAATYLDLAQFLPPIYNGRDSIAQCVWRSGSEIIVGGYVVTDPGPATREAVVWIVPPPPSAAGFLLGMAMSLHRRRRG